MKTTFQMQVGGRDEVNLDIHENNRLLGSLRVTGQGVGWHVGSHTRVFSWEAWLQLIKERKGS